MADIKIVEFEFVYACGVGYRIRCEAQADDGCPPFIARHCEKANLMVLPGAPLAFHEKRGDQWVDTRLDS